VKKRIPLAVLITWRVGANERRSFTIAAGACPSQSANKAFRRLARCDCGMDSPVTSRKWVTQLYNRCDSHPALGDTSPNRKSKRRSNRRAAGAAVPGSECIRRRIGRRQSASFRAWRSRKQGIPTRIPEEALSYTILVVHSRRIACVRSRFGQCGRTGFIGIKGNAGSFLLKIHHRARDTRHLLQSLELS
jgi:hypothetical protein